MKSDRFHYRPLHVVHADLGGAHAHHTPDTGKAEAASGERKQDSPRGGELRVAVQHYPVDITSLVRRDVDEVSPANERQRGNEHGVRRSVGDAKHDRPTRYLVEVVDGTRDEPVSVVEQQCEGHAVHHARRHLEEPRRDTYDVTSAGGRPGHDDEDAREHDECAETAAREEVNHEGVLTRAEQTALKEDEQHETVDDKDEDALDEHRRPHDRVGHDVVYCRSSHAGSTQTNSKQNR